MCRRRRRVLWLQVRRCGHAGQSQRPWCPSRLLPQRCKTRRTGELILGMSCVSILHIRCRDFCALIIDAERSRRRLLCFCRVSGVLGPSICRGNGLPPSRRRLRLPPRPTVYYRPTERPALDQNGCAKDPPNSTGLQVGHSLLQNANV